MRRLFAIAALLTGLLPALAAAQAPPAVPGLPDSERRTSYSLSASTCPACSVGFALYGDGTDYGAWLELWIVTGTGTSAVATKLTAVTDWTLSSATGSLATIPRPITDATITLTAARTGTLQIVGARRPRRTAQFAENRGVAARDLNQTVTDLVAENREIWDKMGRALFSSPGDTIGALPVAAARAGGVLAFNSSGDPIVQAVLTGLGNVIGPNVSVVGHIATFGNTSGTILLDGGLIGAGDMVGPAGATDGAIALFNGTGGKILKNGPAGTTTTVLHGNASGAPTYGAVVLTTDVSGLLPLANGGTNANLTASNGGIFYSTASAGAILSGTATASLPLLSGSTAAPTWATISYPTSATSGGVPYFSSATVMASSAALTVNQIMLGGGAGAAPTTFACATTTTVVHGGTPPTCAQVGLTTDVTGTLPVGNGGTGLATGTSGGVPYFSGTTTIASSALLTANALVLGGGAGAAPSTLIALGTTTTVLHGNAAGVPSFGAVVLTTDVSGILPVANGGNGIASGTSGGILGFTAAGVIASSTQLTINQLLIGGGAGALPIPLGTLGTTTTVLHGNGSGAPTFSAVSLSTDITGTLPVVNGGTGQVTAAAARASSGLNVESFTGHGDSAYNILSTDKVVGTNAVFTASRTWNLPTAASVNPGQPIVVADFQGTVTGSNTLIIARSGSDSINGSTSVTINSANGAYGFWSDGVSKWTAQALGVSATAGVPSFGGVTGAIGVANGLEMNGSNVQITAARRTLPTVQVFLSGSGTYTTPSNVLWIEVEMCAAGGGGGGSGTAAGAGGTGGNTTFGTALLTSNGGVGGTVAGGSASGGTSTGGDENQTGGTGGTSSGSLNTSGGNGGVTTRGGIGWGGAGGGGGTGTAGVANTCAGGGGGGSAGAGNTGGGGGAGGFLRKIINTPSATYSYGVGAAGTAGAAGGSGFGGGLGASGFLKVIERYGS